MQIKRFEEVTGIAVSEIEGNPQMGYSLSDFTDFYDMLEYMKRDGYRGSILTFYDYESGKVYKPFSQERNVIYGQPVYEGQYYWFLQGDFNRNQITLFRYLPQETPEAITQLHIDEVNLYNLRIIGEGIHIISQDDEIACYYPEKFCVAKNSHESLIAISDGKLYICAWVENGWDEENNVATEEYQYYEKLVVKDFNGAVISEEVGALQKCADGTWWIS